MLMQEPCQVAGASPLERLNGEAVQFSYHFNDVCNYDTILMCRWRLQESCQAGKARLLLQESCQVFIARIVPKNLSIKK